MKKFKTLSEPMKIAYIGVAGAIIAAIIGAIIGGIFLYLNNHPTPTPSSLSSLAPTPTPTNTPVPTPPPTPQVIPINQTMSCTDCPDPSLNFSLIVKNATFDPAKSQLTLLIGIQNNTTTSQTEVHFTLLSLQDLQTGVTTNGTGDGFGGIDVAANQLILFRPTFQFVSAAGHEYSLSAEVRGLGFYMIFSPITIKF